MQLHLQFLIPTSLPPRFTSALCSWHSCLLADSLILCIDNLDKDAGSGTSCKHCPSSPYRSLSFPSQTEATVTRPRPLPAHLFSGCCFSVISPPPPPFLGFFCSSDKRTVSRGKTWTGLACSTTTCLELIEIAPRFQHWVIYQFRFWHQCELLLFFVVFIAILEKNKEGLRG